MRDSGARLVYAAIASLDGYVEDQDGAFGWAAPDEEVHALVNDLERPTGTYLYGRRMYETMVFWETAGLVDELHLLPARCSSAAAGAPSPPMRSHGPGCSTPGPSPAGIIRGCPNRLTLSRMV